MRNWKKKISSILICSMLVSSFAPQMRFTANGTTYAPDYEDDIVAEDSDSSSYEEYLEANNYSDAEIARILEEDPYGELASDSNWDLASDSNWDLASDSNWDLASDSNWQPLNIVSYTEAGPLIASPRMNMLRSRMVVRSGDTFKDAPDGLYRSKKVTTNTDGTYTIRLESYVEGAVDIVQGKTNPLDIVLVLDVSGSMKDCITCGKTPSSHCEELASYSYTKLTGSPNRNTTYYYKVGDEYNRAYRCSDCNGTYWTAQHENTGKGDNKRHIKNGTQLDNSALWMQSKTEGGPCVARIDSLKEAVRNFINEVKEDSEAKDGIEHRISVVKFSGSEYTGDKKEGDDTYTSGGNTYNYSQIVKNLTNVESGSSALITAVNNLRPNGSTRADNGMKQAQKVISGIERDRDSDKVVIMFTDGVPTTSSNFSFSVANGAIDASHTIKNTYHGTVYTIGVFAGANPGITDNGIITSNSNTDKYMHYVSSNFPNAQGAKTNNGFSNSNFGQPGDPGDLSNGRYYLAAANPSDLNNIFSEISTQITGGAKYELGTDAVVQDVITPYFETTQRTDTNGKPINSVRVFTSECTGTNSSGAYVFGEDEILQGISPVINGDTVSVSGFDFTKNYVSKNGYNPDSDKVEEGDYHGKKLVIEIDIRAKEEFLGGKGVPTNETSKSGIVVNGEILTNFDPPTPVNVPVSAITVTAEDKNVYLTGSVTADQLKVGSTVTATRYPDEKPEEPVEIDLTANDYGLENWQYEFVDISSSVNPDGFTNLTSDITYDLTVTVKDKKTSTDPTNTYIKSGTAEENKINVFKPELTFKDGEVYYGDNVPSADTLKENNYLPVKTTWKHIDADNSMTVADPEKMIGTAPEVKKFGFEFNERYVKNGKVATKLFVPVTVNALYFSDNTSSTNNMIQHATIIREKCNDNEAELISGAGHFELHVKTCELTLRKTGGAADEPYVFKILKKNDQGKFEEYTWASVESGESVTIYELPVGTYKIEEDENWSWRYSASDDNEVTLSASEAGSAGTLTCNNTKKLSKFRWLNGFSDVVTNAFKKENGTEV